MRADRPTGKFANGIWGSSIVLVSIVLQSGLKSNYEANYLILHLEMASLARSLRRHPMNALG